MLLLEGFRLLQSVRQLLESGLLLDLVHLEEAIHLVLDFRLPSDQLLQLVFRLNVEVLLVLVVRPELFDLSSSCLFLVE